MIKINYYHSESTFSLDCFFFFKNSCYSKLEKADILEMTVQHLKNLKNQQNTGKSNSSFPELFASDSNFMIMMRGFGSLCCCDVTDQ